jgi:hypothetical protein
VEDAGVQGACPDSEPEKAAQPPRLRHRGAVKESQVRDAKEMEHATVKESDLTCARGNIRDTSTEPRRPMFIARK